MLKINPYILLIDNKNYSIIIPEFNYDIKELDPCRLISRRRCEVFYLTLKIYARELTLRLFNYFYY